MTTVARVGELESPLSPPQPPERSSTGKRRLHDVDAMRPVKQAGVVSTHVLLAFAPVTLATGGALMLLHVTREAFLFISACMLTYGYRELRRGGLRRYWRRRLVAVALPYVCWTTVYFFLTLPGSSWTSPLKAVTHFAYLLGTGYYQLYYLVVIMQFYLLFPLLLLWLRKSRHHGRLLAVSLVVQVVLVSLMHWNALPNSMENFWATRELTSYQFYLVAGSVVAWHLDEVQRWLRSHALWVWGAVAISAAIAEAWFVAASRGVTALGTSNDPFQPIVIPFNIAAIASVWLVGMWLVDRRRSVRLRSIVRSGADNAYSVYLAQMVFVLGLEALGWSRLASPAGPVPWPVLTIASLAIVFLACVALGSILARTPLSVALTGRRQETWASLLPGSMRSGARRSTGPTLEPALATGWKEQAA